MNATKAANYIDSAPTRRMLVDCLGTGWPCRFQIRVEVETGKFVFREITQRTASALMRKGYKAALLVKL